MATMLKPKTLAEVLAEQAAKNAPPTVTTTVTPPPTSPTAGNPPPTISPTAQTNRDIAAANKAKRAEMSANS